MGVPDVEHAKRRLQEILRRAQKLEVSTQEVISTRTAQKLLTRSKSALAWSIWIGILVLTLSAIVYSRWPVQEVETVRTVLRRTCGAGATGDFSERVAALLHSSTQDDC